MDNETLRKKLLRCVAESGGTPAQDVASIVAVLVVVCKSLDMPQVVFERLTNKMNEGYKLVVDNE